MYRRILVPYDGSKQSANALKHAVQLAKSSENGAEVVLLYVIEKILLPPSLSHDMIRSPKTGEMIDRDAVLKEIYHNMRQKAQGMLESAIQSVKSPRVQIRKKVVYGLPSESIVEFARRDKIDLIVIGNVGLSGISKLKALGSVSRGVSERAPCPVLIVH